MSHTYRSVLICLLGLVHATCVRASDYQIGPGDLLKVSVFDHPELSSDLRVSASGNVTVPIVGVVNVLDLSTEEAEKKLAFLMQKKNLLLDPQVNVAIAEYISKKITVMGLVSKPGQYPLTEQRTVLDALALAGGLVPGLAADDLVITQVNGARTVVDLRKLMDGDLSQNKQLIPGDALLVPKAPQFYILGEVQHPGAYRLERGMTLSQAVSAGGGLTSKGTLRGLVIKRKADGADERSLSAKEAGALRADDVVVVKERWF